MKKRIDYSELMEKWMQYYSISAERAKKMLSSIMTHLQSQRSKTNGERETTNEAHME